MRKPSQGPYLEAPFLTTNMVCNNHASIEEPDSHVLKNMDMGVLMGAANAMSVKERQTCSSSTEHAIYTLVLS